MALMTSLPVRMPESKRTVNLPCSWPRRTLDDAVIFSRALNEPIAPSICRAPAKQKKERTGCDSISHRAQGGAASRPRAPRTGRTVVRHDDAIHAGVHRGVGILNRLNALEHDRAVPVVA